MRHHDLQGTNAALGSASHMKVNFQFPLKHVDSRYSCKINFIFVQIFVLGEKQTQSTGTSIETAGPFKLLFDVTDKIK